MAVWGRVQPSALFGDHAVLLKSADTPVFGFADPGERVRVTFGGVSAEGQADGQGKWLVRLDLRETGADPKELKINDLVAHDVVVGEVWLCSGQSNMSLKMKEVDDADAENAATNLSLRCFVAGGWAATEPQERIQGRWLVARPGETPNMTAVGYHFAKKLQTELQMPVGIVESAVGAASIEAWCDPVTMSVDPAGKRELDRQIAFMANYRAYEDRCQAALRAWERKWDRADRPHGPAPTTGWRALTEKERVHAAFRYGAGAIWLRHTVPPQVKGKELRLDRRRFVESQWRFDDSVMEVYWNGERLVKAYPESPIEKNTEIYRVPAAAAAAGGVFTVRLFNAVMIPGVVEYFLVNGRRTGGADWELAEEYRLPPFKAGALDDLPPRQRFCLAQHYPTGLFNGKIAGLVPMGLSGVIWYQGESNATPVEGGGGPAAYADLFGTMIKSWRQLFQKPDLPFAWCQLAAYTAKAKDPNDPANELWPRLREAQTKTLALPHTGQAILIDAGEEQDIHPRDKRTPGERLAAWALNQVYGRRALPYRGPHMASVRVAADKLVVSFAACGKGLMARDLGDEYLKRWTPRAYGKVRRNSPQAQVEGFSLAGADGVWHWADKADIQGEAVVVSATQVPKPVAVRYGFAANPWVNLYNAEGLPAEPFEWRPSAAR